MIDELKGIWMETIVVGLQVLTRNLSGRTEGNYENHLSGYQD
jgi:hypothetical protein